MCRAYDLTQVSFMPYPHNVAKLEHLLRSVSGHDDIAASVAKIGTESPTERAGRRW